MSKLIIRFFLFLLLLAGITEVVLRVKFGFCNAPLYVSDPDYEYIFAPGQRLDRFGNIIRTNSLSMRSDEVSDSDSITILLTGDSVINGGSLTDHDSLASTKLEKRLSLAIRKKVRVLNIASGSWGPDNVAGYLKKHGLFHASLICLVTSSHDAHDIMARESRVGIDPNMPSKQYKVALVELWDRYREIVYYKVDNFFFPPPKPVAAPPLDSLQREKLRASGIRKPGEGFNPGYAQILEMAKKDSIPFFIYLHPEISEVALGTFNDQGEEIIGFARENNVRLVNEFDLGISLDDYRDTDVIHYNDKGQEALAKKLYPLFLGYLTNRK